jgi:hypothetical protein
MYRKSGLNYEATINDQTIDFCQFTEGTTNPFLTLILPKLKESLGLAFHPCPYSVSVAMCRQCMKLLPNIVKFIIGTIIN